MTFTVSTESSRPVWMIAVCTVMLALASLVTCVSLVYTLYLVRGAGRVMTRAGRVVHAQSKELLREGVTLAQKGQEMTTELTRIAKGIAGSKSNKNLTFKLRDVAYVKGAVAPKPVRADVFIGLERGETATPARAS